MTINRQLKFTIVVCTLSAIAVAADLNIKPGLWELTTDLKGFTTPAAEKAEMDKALAEMPPEQRAKTEAYLRSAQAAAKPSVGRYCVTKEEANTIASTFNRPGRDSTCKRTEIRSTATTREFREECSGEGGKSSVTVRVVAANPETLTWEVFSGKGEVMKTSGRWLGADCGEVKPSSVR